MFQKIERINPIGNQIWIAESFQVVISQIVRIQANLAEKKCMLNMLEILKMLKIQDLKIF